VPLLTTALRDGDWSVRKRAAESLGRMGPSAKAAVPALFALLSSEEDRDAARGALREIDAVGPEALPALIKALEVDDGRVRYYAVFYLGKLGPAAKEALPALRRLTDDDSDRFRGFLDRTIKSIDGE
jgi:hypothetical protein